MQKKKIGRSIKIFNQYLFRNIFRSGSYDIEQENLEVVIVGPFVLHDDTVKNLNMEHRYRVSLLLIALRHQQHTYFNLCVDFLRRIIRISLHFLKWNLNFVIGRGDLSEKNLNINSRGICVALRPVGISRSTPPSHHYPFKCNIGKAFRDEGDYELSQPLKP